MPRLPQPAPPSSQCRANTHGLTGRPMTTSQSAPSPMQASSSPARPCNLFTHHPGPPSARQMATWQPNPYPLTQPRLHTTNQPPTMTTNKLPTRSLTTRHPARTASIPLVLPRLWLVAEKSRSRQSVIAMTIDGLAK
jgi:hypothetical protein